jgi:hypothetical protein
MLPSVRILEMRSVVESKQTSCIEGAYNVELNVYIISRETPREIMYLEVQLYNLPSFNTGVIALTAEPESEDSLCGI